MPQPSCEERINEHKMSRLDDFAALVNCARFYDDEWNEDILQDAKAADIYTDEIHPNNLCEVASERIWDYPLSVSTQKVFKIELSTGGPADWLEIICDTDSEWFDPGDVVRVVYHFADWFDHASVELEGDQHDLAVDFAAQLIPS